MLKDTLGNNAPRSEGCRGSSCGVIYSKGDQPCENVKGACDSSGHCRKSALEEGLASTQKPLERLGDGRVWGTELGRVGRGS